MTNTSITQTKIKSKIEMVGKKFGRLLAIEKAGKTKRGDILWRCLCDCGNEPIIRGSNMRNGNTKSCGCLFKESLSKRFTKHKMCHTPTYCSWDSMFQRCNNSNNPHYKDYGGRGIKICDSWLKFENFYKDMGKRPDLSFTIERVNNNKGYFSGNCMWATRSEQSRNKRIRKDNKTGVAGITWDKQRQKYHVSIAINHKSFFIGRFATLDQAKENRLVAEQFYWGKIRKERK